MYETSSGTDFMGLGNLQTVKREHGRLETWNGVIVYGKSRYQRIMDPDLQMAR